MWYLEGKTEVQGEKYAPVSLFLLQISHTLYGLEPEPSRWEAGNRQRELLERWNSFNLLERQCTYNVTMSRFRETIFAVEKQ
jgi:hypothetical protein